jgi:hypothetical protein
LSRARYSGEVRHDQCVPTCVPIPQPPSVP